MDEPSREPSMEDILASIRKVIAEERPAAATDARPAHEPDVADVLEEGVLELDQPVGDCLPADPGPPLVSDAALGSTRQSLGQLASVAASIPPANPLEAMVRDLLRPMLKEWLDARLPEIVDEHVRREIARISGIDP